MSNTDILLGLGVGVGIGFAIGYLFVQRSRGGLTTFTRDSEGRVLEVMERSL